MLRRRLLLFAALGTVIPGALGQSREGVRRIAILEQGNRAMRAEQWRVFDRQLRDHGYVEGRNLVVERRWADGVDSRLPQLAQELLAGNPEVVIAITTPATQSLRRLTDKVPIVMAAVADPVAAGLVASLSHPGGNVTGISLDLGSVIRKRLELLREIMPKARHVGLIGPGSNLGVQVALKQAQEAGKLLGVEVRLIEATSDSASIARAFERLRPGELDALLATQVMLQHNELLIELAAQKKLPAAFVDREALDSGAVLVFGPERDAPFVHAADYVHRILKGASPADLPVIQPTQYWLGVNLKSARALGIKVPSAVLLRADQVIE